MFSARAGAPLPHSQRMELELSKRPLKQAQAELTAILQQLQVAQAVNALPAVTQFTAAHLSILFNLYQLSLQFRQEETNELYRLCFKQGLDSLAWYIVYLQNPDLTKINTEQKVLELGLIHYEPTVLAQPQIYHVEKIQSLITLLKKINDITKLNEKLDNVKNYINVLSQQYTSLKFNYQALNSEEGMKFPTYVNPKRFKYTLIESDGKKENSGLGYSAFVTHTATDKKASYVLDAEFQLGSAGTTADGIGELHDEVGNAQIARVAYFAAKYLTTYSHQYSHPDSLYKALPVLIQRAGEVAREKCYESDAASAVVFTHAYYYHPGNIKVVAAGIGDCMAVIWRPQQQMLIPLITARQFYNGFQFNPASITDLHLPKEAIQIKQVQINTEDVIIRMTDGVWELLPCYSQLTTKYLEYFPDVKKFNQIFSTFYMNFTRAEKRKPNADDYQNFLAEYLKTQAKTRYKILYDENGLILFLSNALAKLNPQLTVITCLQSWKIENAILAEKLNQYLNIAAYVIEDPAFQSFTVGELVTRLQQPLQIGDDATCSIHVVNKDTCTVVKNSLTQPLNTLKSFLRCGCYTIVCCFLETTNYVFSIGTIL